MTGTAKWLMVGSVVIIATGILIAVGLFTWMVFRTPMMSSTGAGWGMPLIQCLAAGRMDSWCGGRGTMGGPSGAMGNYGFVGPGMMGIHGYGAPQSSGGATAEALTFEVVEARLEEFLGSRSDLVVAEIMIFDNHAYAEIVETDTGIGAMEVLVDPFTLSVSPEHGPNMMWNTKYGGMHGGMMGFARGGSDPGEMTVSSEKAIEYAQAYLDRYAPNLDAADHVDPFYGYYTIHTMHDGEVVGMLSVNGYTGDVFPHTWHGELLVMSETEHE